jgi:chorismate synthase
MTTPCSPPLRRSCPAWEDYLDGVRKAGSSIGAVVALEVTGVPAGWGAPIYGKLDAELAAAMMSINAVKGVEIGAGFEAAELSGEENADQMRMGDDGQPVFLSNRAGGVLGGISTGQPLTGRVAFKPTSSILTLRQTVTRDGSRNRPAHQGAGMTPASPCAAFPWWRRWRPAFWPTRCCGTGRRWSDVRPGSPSTGLERNRPLLAG